MTVAMEAPLPAGNPMNGIVQQQLSSLDATDAYASAWKDLVQQQGGHSLWGGRGRGGRGLARRTYQPRDIVVEDVTLEYVSAQERLPSKLLLENATLKLLAGHVYALVGRNGVGKSTLLRRIRSGKIPGFPPHVATLYIPQELLLSATDDPECSALQLVQDQFTQFSKQTNTSLQCQMDMLEKQLEELDDTDEEKMESLCEEISNLQEAMDEANEDGHPSSSVGEQAKEALTFFGLEDGLISGPYKTLSPGRRKKVALAVAVLCASTVSPSQQFLLCLDEPTNHLDVAGLVQLRRFLLQTEQTQNRTVLVVSHDTDLLNDVATDTISFSHWAKTLAYYPGNYWDYQRQYAQHELHMLRQQVSLDKKRNHLVQNIHHLQDQPAPKRGGNRKKAKMIAAQRKKLERQGIEKDEKGHRWTQQKAATGIQKGSLNSLDASTRKDLTTAKLLKLAEASVRPPPDKAVQFVFRNTNCTWGEPLIMAMDVGHGYGYGPFPETADKVPAPSDEDPIVIRKKPGYLFDCVDLCVKEGHKYCLLGDNSSGKTTLLRLLAKREEPLEGSIHHASNVQIGYLGQETMDQLLEDASASKGVTTALSYLAERYPSKTEKELRGELTNFGLSPTQAATNVRFLSGGERCRLCLAALMLEHPHVLCLDNPTTNLDVESVEALIHGLQQWKDGTVVMISHDINVIRSLEAECAVLVESEGKLRRIDGTIDQYLKTFKY